MGFGTTTVEAKSGYGLATEHELKALEVIKDLNDHHRMDLVATFMGAHLVPAEYKSNREEYVRLVCEEMMPKVKEQGIAKFCDVFCEADTFTVEESRQVLEAGSQVRSAPEDPRRRDRGHRRQPARRRAGSDLRGASDRLPARGHRGDGKGRRDRPACCRDELQPRCGVRAAAATW